MSDELVITPIPALCTVLVSAERQKGSALTESDVVQIAGKCACMALPAEAAKALEESRGYADIDPANAWPEWQSFREWYYGSKSED